MKTGLKPWLPDHATDPARVAGLIDDVLKEWSKHWLKSELASCTPACQHAWPEQVGAARCRTIPEVVSVALTASAPSAVASAMLGCAVPHGSVQARDRAILESLATAAIDDLLERIASLSLAQTPKVVAEPMEAGRRGTWEVSFRSGKQAFRLAISSEAQVAMIKRRLPPATTPKLAGLDRGLAAQPVELAVDLGRCRIPLSDLQGLGCGDVILLDRCSADAVGVLVDGFASPLRGTLRSTDDLTEVVLDQWRDHHHA